MELDDLLQKLKSINFEKDSIYLVENIIKKIDSLEPKNNIFINKLLDTIESQDGEIFARMMLTCTLRKLSMTYSQIEKIWEMINNTKRYNSGFREYLMKVLCGIALDEHEHIIKELYRKFKNEACIKEKIQIAEVLLNVNTICDEISSWLFNFAVNDKLPNEINETNTLSLKIDCCNALSTHENSIKSSKEAMFHLIIQCNFFKYHDNHQWDIIKDNFLKMTIDEKDIYTILKLVKDHNLISYHRIHILNLLTEVTVEIDIVTSLIDILIMEDESFSEFNMSVLEVILKFIITQEHVKYIEILQESDTVSRRAKIQLKNILA